MAMNDEFQKVDIIWISPWFGSLTSRYLEIFSKSNRRNFLITTDEHLDPKRPTFQNTWMYPSKNSRLRKYVNLAKIQIKVQNSDPKVVIADLPKRIPLLLTLLSLSLRFRLILSIHDPTPHDNADEVSRLISGLTRIVLKCSSGVLVFSELSKKIFAAQYPESNIYTIPLLPETKPGKPIYDHKKRKNFAMIGRWSNYKGFEEGLEFWREFTRLNPSNNDEMELWVSGLLEPIKPQDRLTLKSDKSFTWDQIRKALPEYKAVLLPYQSASQSGVQILAWSSGVACIVSDVAGLTQNQPPEISGTPLKNKKAWVDQLEKFSDSKYATRIGISGLESLSNIDVKFEIVSVLSRIVEGKNE